jgi:hypothetical protein
VTQILLLIQRSLDGNNTNTTTEKHVVLLHYYNRFACLFHKKIARLHHRNLFRKRLAVHISSKAPFICFFFHKHGCLIHLAIDYTIFRLFIKAML